jgi:ABC-type antimicrobial peptide transport system, ATPase component
MSKNVFIEKPIEKENEDLFEISTYVYQLQNAINAGAKFIAIDGEHGSGKSSVINMLENKEKKERKNTTFVNTNFLNISENEINSYHRYFVNQVANDICDNPFEIEKIFYHNHISYSVTNPSKNKLWRVIVDKLLLMLTSFMVIYLTYATFFKSIELFQFIFVYCDIYVPIILLVMFILVIIYGYGIYKPNNSEQSQSPMLDTDKCKINFCKIVSTKLKRNMVLNRKEKTRLFLVIDDLDRIVDNDLQVNIISLLYNEYYPLKIKDVEIIFIFMLDTHKLSKEFEKEDLSSDKLFDYILPVSNNQKHIIRHLTNKMINENTSLDEIFNNEKIKNKDYIINLICRRYTTIRKIKHFFNKLTTKYEYLKNKKLEEINYDEMIVICLLLDMTNTSILDLAISSIINNEPLIDSMEKIKNILKELHNKKVFDINYYIYLYNFIDIEDMLNHNESEIYSIAEKGYAETTFEEDAKIIEYLEAEKVRFDKVYHEIFSFLDNDTKLIFIGSKKFCDYIIKASKLFSEIDITNAYKNNYGHYLCEHVSLNTSQKEKIVFDLKSNLDNYISNRTPDNLQKLNEELKKFIEKMADKILQFSIKEYFDEVTFDNKIYKLLFEDIKHNNCELGYELLNKDIIDCNSIKDYINSSLIDKVNLLEDKLKVSIKTKILNSDYTPIDGLIRIISEENTKYNSIESIYDRINAASSFINFEKLILILINYGYNEKLDKHIIKCLETNKQKMIDNINKNKYSLSMELMNSLNSLTTVYSFSSYYEKQFMDNEFYSLYIYSKILNNKKMGYLQKHKDNKEYMNAVLNNYKNINKWASKYTFSKNYTKHIINNFDFNSIAFSDDNFWKLIHLIPYSDLTDFDDILSSLKTNNKIDDFFAYCAKQGRKIDISFVKYLRGYAEEHNLSSKVKTRLTKSINRIEKQGKLKS